MSQTPFLAMELVGRQSLSQRLRVGALEFPEVARFALQIAEALEAAHEIGVVHRLAGLNTEQNFVSVTLFSGEIMAVVGGNEWNSRFFGQHLGHKTPEFRMGIDPASDGSPTDRKLEDGLKRVLGPLDRELQLPRKSTNLLTQSQWRRIHQVSSPNFDDLIPLLSFLGKRCM